MSEAEVTELTNLEPAFGNPLLACGYPSPTVSPVPARSPVALVSSSTLSPTSTSASPTSSSPTGASPSATLSPLLPPCRVCGEKASGFHYGANTCEACKGFFRRSLARKANYRCAGSETCEIEPGKRSTCAYCRYQKCLAIGMSKDAIKTGRYTHEKKTRDIEEVKRLQNRAAKVNKARGVPDTAQREAELDRIIQHITAAHLAQTPHSPEFFQKLPEKEAEYLEKRALQEKMFGPMKPIPREEYQQIYKTTGIDIDGRREMISQIIPGIERAIKRFINFAKALPGFKELPIEDQIALIKVHRPDMWLISSHLAWNMTEAIYTGCDGITVSVDSLQVIHSQQTISHFTKIVSMLQKLRLTEGEIALMLAIALMATELVELQEPTKVYKCQQTMAEALYHRLKVTRPNEPFIFLRVITCLTELRSLAPNCAQAIKHFTELSDLPLPQLLVDMWMG